MLCPLGGLTVRLATIFSAHLALAVSTGAQAQQFPAPQAPGRPTVDSCTTYKSALAAQIQGIYKRTTACMSKGPSWSTWLGNQSDRRPWCTPGPPSRLRAEVTAYPDCASEQETLCEAYEAQRTQLPACFKQAKASGDVGEQRLGLASDMMDLHQRYKRAERIIWNPEAFLEEVVVPRLPSHVRAKLDMYVGMVNTDVITFNPLKPLPATVDLTTFGMPSHLSPKGAGIAQDLYEYLFSGTLGNERLRSGNPVIAAIQGDVAKKIKSVHSSMLGEMERVGNLMDSFIAPAPSSSAPAVVTISRPQYGNVGGA